MIITVASVHHSGTHFICDELFKGWHSYSMSPNAHGFLADGYCRIHCDIDQVQYLPWWLARFPSVVPIRHPAAVAASWKARGSNLDLLPGQWEILKKTVDPYDPVYIPLDAPDRDDWLARLNKRLDLELQTDWPVVMSCNKSAELSENDREAVAEVMADGFFDCFGYEV